MCSYPLNNIILPIQHCGIGTFVSDPKPFCYFFRNCQLKFSTAYEAHCFTPFL